MKKILIALSFFTAMFLNSCIKNQIIIDDYNSDGFKVTNQMLDFKSLTDMGNYMQKSNDNQQVLLSQKSIGFNSYAKKFEDILVDFEKLGKTAKDINEVLNFKSSNSKYVDFSNEEVAITIPSLFRFIANPEGYFAIDGNLCLAKENCIIIGNKGATEVTLNTVFENKTSDKNANIVFIQQFKKTRANFTGQTINNTSGSVVKYNTSNTKQLYKSEATSNFSYSITFTPYGATPIATLLQAAVAYDVYNYKRGFLNYWYSHTCWTHSAAQGSTSYAPTYTTWGWPLTTSHVYHQFFVKSTAYNGHNNLNSITTTWYGSINHQVGVIFESGFPMNSYSL